MKQINTWMPDQILLCLILFVLCAPGECSSWEYLGLLGPILFLIYMDDIQHCTIVTVDFTYFADDTNVCVFISGKTVSDLGRKYTT